MKLYLIPCLLLVILGVIGAGCTQSSLTGQAGPVTQGTFYSDDNAND